MLGRMLNRRAAEASLSPSWRSCRHSRREVRDGGRPATGALAEAGRKCWCVGPAGRRQLGLSEKGAHDGQTEGQACGLGG